MTDLPRHWRIFKGLSIIQMIMVIFMLVISLGGIFYGDNISWRLFEGVCYGLMLIFLYQGLTILNDNYPETPLSIRQKRNFNPLFIANFLLIAFLFAKVVVQWRYVRNLVTNYDFDAKGNFLVYLPLAVAFLVFALNVIHLAGMYQLRTIIGRNNQKKIDEI